MIPPLVLLAIQDGLTSRDLIGPYDLVLPPANSVSSGAALWQWSRSCSVCVFANTNANAVANSSSSTRTSPASSAWQRFKFDV